MQSKFIRKKYCNNLFKENTVTMGSSVKVFLALKLFYFLISRDAFM
ncbi:hypothetical protein BD94_1828 [Elizabethkingia anophelis NUHP1]|uniref:Uncharacterized protein n=1 Tax=Elizabethkingia anophelis NUHP1 TaxID=1338011 RepID=A0A077EGC9_9FLAO|nr:hypothetical protein BD94_1828 [Elizabethkingia anophelis NUHP1]